MMRAMFIPFVTVGLALAMTAPVMAQRGTGADQGVARGNISYDPQTVSGTVVETVVTECPQTTGRFDVGMHMTAELMDGQRVDIHLGPEPVLGDLEAALDEGDAFRADVFRTDVLPPATFVAVVVEVDDETFELRDPETLKPSWSRGPGSGGGRGAGTARGGCWWAVPSLD